MAYTGHTWTTNEVITTARMNALETGAEEAYLWSEAVIDSDKDMSGNSLTNLDVVDAVIFRVYASDDVRLAPGGHSLSDTNVWTKVVEYSMPAMISSGSVVRVKARVQATNAGSAYRVYVNGAAVGTEHVVATNGGFTDGSDDITLNRDDTLEIWLYRESGGSVSALNINICHTDPLFGWGVTPV